MEAIILAGGLGRRLREVVQDVPKPMANIDGHPFLYYLFLYLSAQGIEKVILSTGYKHSSIEKYFGDFCEGIRIQYSFEDRPLGTGGAIKKALGLVSGEHTFILNGDTFFDLNFKNMLAHHNFYNSDITIGLKPMREFDRYGAVLCDGSRVTSFKEKEYTQIGNINGGIYILKKTIFNETDTADAFSFENDFLSPNTKLFNIQGYVSDTYFIDIGVPIDYFRAQEELKKFI